MEPLQVYCPFSTKQDELRDSKKLVMVAKFMWMCFVYKVGSLKNKDAKNVVRIVEVICEHQVDNKSLVGLAL
jgi:hypothetical protein